MAQSAEDPNRSYQDSYCLSLRLSWGRSALLEVSGLRLDGREAKLAECCEDVSSLVSSHRPDMKQDTVVSLWIAGDLGDRP